ncbi:MAG TPA: FxLYD domain-containing protein [Bryobacteraceae bacterium]|nr:FxLYD domain-containing protein [Bryobacteraceae bacterium]
MARSLREVLESIVFAGMKPGTPAQTQRKPVGGLRARLERFLAGGPAPSDPLYLSRRTPAQRILRASVIGVPCLLVAGAIGFALTNHFAKKASDKLDLTPAEVAAKAAKMLPKMDQIKLDTNRDVDIMEVHIDRSKGIALMATVMNNTTHPIPTAEIVFDLTDASGSQLGGVSQKLENLPPRERQTFRLPIEQENASLVIVREVRTR